MLLDNKSLYVTGMEMGLRKRQRGSDAFIIFRVLAWMSADVQMNGDISNAHVQCFFPLEDQSRQL